MYKDKSVGVIVPAYNEGTQIRKVLMTMPDYVDWVVVVDDASQDSTRETVKSYQNMDHRVILIEHEKNEGVGGAIASGYKWARDNGLDCAVVMAGDGQMDPKELPVLLDPVVTDKSDYTKGNRLFTGDAYRKIPKVRYFGNGFLSLMTKIASGYWHIADSQSGYTVINKMALKTIDWNKMYKCYGQPNDLLVRLNVYSFRVTDIPVEPVYNIGEKSGIKIPKVIFTIGWLLIKLFLWRMKEKYIIRDFHPLIFFYFIGFLFSLSTGALSLRIIYFKFSFGFFPPTSCLALMFSFMSASLFVLFAMWFDMEVNKDLK
jgi:glycosyltransferase involved in cell wall biosynthesis